MRRLHFQGTTVVIADQTVHNVSADLALQDGHLSLRPVLDVAGGTLRAQVEVDDRGEAPLHSAIQADIAQVNVQQVLAVFGMEHQAAGRVDGHIDLAASGRSLPQLLSSLAGKAALRVRDQASHTDFRMTFATESWDPAGHIPRAPCQPGSGARRAVPPRGARWGVVRRAAALARADAPPPGGDARPTRRHPGPGATAHRPCGPGGPPRARSRDGSLPSSLSPSRLSQPTALRVACCKTGAPGPSRS